MELYFAIDKEHLSLKTETVNGLKSRIYPKVEKSYSLLDVWEKNKQYLQVSCGCKGPYGDRQMLVIDFDNPNGDDPYEYISELNYRFVDLGIEHAVLGSLINTKNGHVQSYVKIDRVWRNKPEYSSYLSAVRFLNGDGFGDPNFKGQNAKNPFTVDPSFKFIKNSYYDGSSINVVDFCKENVLSVNSQEKHKAVTVKTKKVAGQKIEYADELKTEWTVDRIQEYWKSSINMHITAKAAGLMQKSRCYFFICLGTFFYRSSREEYAKFSSAEELLGKAIALINESGMYNLSGCRYEYMLRQVNNGFAYAEKGYKCGNYEHSGLSHELSDEEFSSMTQGRIWLNKAFILQALIDDRNGKVPVWTYGKAIGKAVSQKTITKWKTEYDIETLKNELLVVCEHKAQKQMEYDGSVYQEVYTRQIESLPYCVIYEFNKKNRVEVFENETTRVESLPVLSINNNKKDSYQETNVVKGETLKEYRARELSGRVNSGGGGEERKEGEMTREEILNDWIRFLREENKQAAVG